jgi:hypothetical protein
MKETLNVVTEVDFVTCGIKPKGELLQRACKVLLDYEKSKVEPCRREEFPLEAARRLVQQYVKGQDIIFEPYIGDAEDWLIKRLVWTFMNSAGFQRPLQKAIEVRNQIEDASNGSELYAVALDIIHEYETYCSHKAVIAKYVKAQRKIIDSNRKELFNALEKRDGSFCQRCGSVEILRIDHKKPLSLGGSSVLGNLQLLCRFCNGSKGNRPMDYLYRRVNKSRKV